MVKDNTSQKLEIVHSMLTYLTNKTNCEWKKLKRFIKLLKDKLQAFRLSRFFNRSFFFRAAAIVVCTSISLLCPKCSRATSSPPAYSKNIHYTCKYLPVGSASKSNNLSISHQLTNYKLSPVPFNITISLNKSNFKPQLCPSKSDSFVYKSQRQAFKPTHKTLSKDSCDQLSFLPVSRFPRIEGRSRQNLGTFSKRRRSDKPENYKSRDQRHLSSSFSSHFGKGISVRKRVHISAKKTVQILFALSEEDYTNKKSLFFIHIKHMYHKTTIMSKWHTRRTQRKLKRFFHDSITNAIENKNQSIIVWNQTRNIFQEKLYAAQKDLKQADEKKKLYAQAALFVVISKMHQNGPNLFYYLPQIITVSNKIFKMVWPQLPSVESFVNILKIYQENKQSNPISIKKEKTRWNLLMSLITLSVLL
uniref:hypothetical protein n=1 Tax=Klebsormidium subtilissimum TaxID=184584 RepID=UPI00286C8877|nr:hypothetical protein RMD59_pgp049 [Klebsormidium subtilissimum]WKT08118.1 hypothetical protein [Klebsormidium subtilissimum]